MQRNILRHIFLFTTACLFAVSLNAQNLPASTGKGKQTPFRFYMQATAMVPHPVSNLAFRRSFTGIYSATASATVEAFRGFAIGGEYTNMLWKTPDNKIPGLNTYAQYNAGGIRLMYQLMGGSVTMYQFGFSAGETTIHYYNLSYTNVTEPPKTKYKAVYLGPEIGVCFFTEGNFAIGLNMGWTLYDYQFDPYALYLNQHKAYQDDDLKGNIQHFNFGFSVLFGFKKKS